MNPIQLAFDRLLQFVRQLVMALLGGILRAPLTAAEKALPLLDVAQAPARDVIDVRHAVLRVGRPRETAQFDGDDEPATRHWTVRHEARVIGVVSIMARDQPDGDGTLQLRGMAVVDDWRGRGVGGVLLKAVVADVGAPLWCNARQQAVPFYESHGWVVVGEPFDIPPIGPHRRMTWTP